MDESHLDRPRVERIVDDWVRTCQPETNGSVVKSEDVVEQFFRLFSRIGWPRGNGPGQLLLKPEFEGEEAAIGQRGVSLIWIHAAWVWMKSIFEYPLIPTRIFTEVFTRAFTDDTKLPLFYYVPKKFRGPPVVMLSHSWDCFFRQLFFLSDEIVIDIQQRQGVKSRDQVFCWIDVFAVTQHPVPQQKDEIHSIGQLVSDIGLTVVLFPGEGPGEFPYKPIVRSWCVYEMCYSKSIIAKAGLSSYLLNPPKESFLSKREKRAFDKYLTRLIDDMASLQVQDASATVASDKQWIDELVIEKFGDFARANDTMRKVALKAFADKYKALAEIQAKELDSLANNPSLLTTARVVVGIDDSKDELIEVRPASQIKVGDMLVIRTGDIIPADGEIASSDEKIICRINDGIITGESLPVRRLGGEEVFYGTTCVSVEWAEDNITKPVDEFRMTVKAVEKDSFLLKVGLLIPPKEKVKANQRKNIVEGHLTNVAESFQKALDSIDLTKV